MQSTETGLPFPVQLEGKFQQPETPDCCQYSESLGILTKGQVIWLQTG